MWPATATSYFFESYRGAQDNVVFLFLPAHRYYEIKSHLLDKCQDDLLKIAEYEKAEETQEADISNEHQ